MRLLISTLLVLLFTVGLISSCLVDNKEKEEDLLNEYPLRQMGLHDQVTENTNGGFLLLVGAFSSKKISELKIRFLVNGNNGFQFIEIPLENTRFKVDSNYIRPVVIAKDWHFDDEFIKKYRTWTIKLHSKYLPENLKEININNYEQRN